MAIVIQVFKISRRETVGESFPAAFKPWANKYAFPELLLKAVNAWRMANSVRLPAYFERLDAPHRLPCGAVIVLGRIRSSPRSRFSVSRDLSGVVEVRITGLAADFDLGVPDGR